MTPIDDELRALFSSRADVLTPAADPLAGIERRAKRMRRNRVAASVVGSALAVSALAVTVPAFLPDSRSGSDVIVPATEPASPEPSVAPSPSAVGGLHPAALNPQDPWEYRGDPALIAANELRVLRSEWSAKHPGTTLTPLFGQVYEPSGQSEIVFVSTAQGSDRWGVATSTESGPEFVVDQALPYGTKVLMAALSGDEVARLLVLAAPSTGQISYAADGRTFTDYDGPVPGVAFFPLEGDTSRDTVRVLDGDGDLDDPVFLGTAPDAGSADDGGAPTGTTPDNLVSWPTRGAAVDPAFWEQALSAYARSVGAKRNDVEGKVLFAGDDDARNRFVLAQAWISGNDAHTFGYSVNADGEATPFLGPITSKGPAVLALLVPAGTGQTTDTLVVVPEPAVKKTYYGQPQSEWVEIVGQEHLEGVALIDRQPDASGDLIKLETASGQLVFRGEVQPLLCGAKECG